jgi:hypothetical protein
VKNAAAVIFISVLAGLHGFAYALTGVIPH